MNKAELIALVAEQAELTKDQAAAAVDSVFDNIVKTVAKGDTVALLGFGTFKQVARAERTGRNPATKETITIAAKAVPKFVPGAPFKKLVDGAAAQSA